MLLNINTFGLLNLRRVSIITVVAGILLSQHVWAQSDILEEVIVTAQKREQNLQQTPISVSAFTAESLNSKGLNNLAQIGDFAPNVTLDFTSPISGASSTLVAYIRGIGQSDFAMNFEPGVGVYVDGVYYARTVGSVIDMLDIDHIEILKGPQGTLFGRNTIGGAINVVTGRPTDKFAAGGEFTFGRYNRQDFRGKVNIPLLDNVVASISVSSKNRDGYVHRIAFPGFSNAEPSDLRYDNGLLDDLPNGNDLGNENNNTVRTKLLWDIDETKELLISVDYEHVRENSAPSTSVAIFPNGPDGLPGTADDTLSALYNACTAGIGPPICTNVAGVGDLTGRTPYDARFLTGDKFTTYGNSISGTAIDTWGISATFSWELSGSLSLKSITAYRELDSAFGEDADGSPLVIDHHGFSMAQEQVTQELQLIGQTARLRWITGAYYFYEDGGIHDLVPLGGGLLQVDGPNDIENQSFALFGQATYNITEPWSVTFGARYTWEYKDFTGGQRDRNALAFNLGLPLALHPDPTDPTLYFPPGLNEQDFTDFSIRAGMEYQLNAEIFTYVSYAEGFKAGGWDTRLTAPNLEVPPFAEESAKTIELGIKSEWLDRSLRLNVAGFFTDYGNLQLIVQKGISPLTANAGKSEITGAEVELEWLPMTDLLLSGNYGWIDAEYTRLDAAANAAGIFLANKFNNTPEHAFSIAADYTQRFGNGGALAWHLDYAWKDDHFNDAVNTPELFQDAFGLLNASITYNSPDERWFIGFGGQNITDKEYIVSGFNQPGIGYITATRGRPAEWWGKIGFNFQ